MSLCVSIPISWTKLEPSSSQAFLALEKEAGEWGKARRHVPLVPCKIYTRIKFYFNGNDKIYQVIVVSASLLWLQRHRSLRAQPPVVPLIEFDLGNPLVHFTGFLLWAPRILPKDSPALFQFPRRWVQRAALVISWKVRKCGGIILLLAKWHYFPPIEKGNRHPFPFSLLKLRTQIARCRPPSPQLSGVPAELKILKI